MWCLVMADCEGNTTTIEDCRREKCFRNYPARRTTNARSNPTTGHLSTEITGCKSVLRDSLRVMPAKGRRCGL